MMSHSCEAQMKRAQVDLKDVIGETALGRSDMFL
jgi:hypothetical protein